MTGKLLLFDYQYLFSIQCIYNSLKLCSFWLNPVTSNLHDGLWRRLWRTLHFSGHGFGQRTILLQMLVVDRCDIDMIAYCMMRVACLQIQTNISITHGVVCTRGCVCFSLVGRLSYQITSRPCYELGGNCVCHVGSYLPTLPVFPVSLPTVKAWFHIFLAQY